MTVVELIDRLQGFVDAYDNELTVLVNGHPGEIGTEVSGSMLVVRDGILFIQV